jgi:hypothetical protein
MLIPHILFLCIGFIAAVLGIDLIFDVSLWTHRRQREVLPPEVLAPVATYYRYITKDPRMLQLAILTATACVTLEIVFGLVPRALGYLSLLLIGPASLVAVLKVIPAAQRLASAQDDFPTQSRLAHSLFLYHTVLLAAVLLFAAVRLVAPYTP